MEMMDEKIEAVLDKIRPFLRRDGGDIEYFGFKEGVAYVSMKGACEGCVYAQEDISAGVDIILCEEVPGVIKVDGTGNVPDDVMEQYRKRKNIGQN